MRTSAPILDAESGRLAAREQLLRTLALAASDPASARFADVLDPRSLELACAAARYLAEDPGARPACLAPGEEPPQGLDLDALVLALGLPRQQLTEDHVRVFGLVVSKECPPYEVQYCPQTFSVHRSQRMADVAGFYRAFGVGPGRDAPERVDHIACELEFLAWLVAKERHAHAQAGAEGGAQGGEDWAERARLCREAQHDFLAEHVAWWVPAFAHALHERARSLDPPPALALALASALARTIPAERALLGVESPAELARPSLDEDGGAVGEDACGGCSPSGGG